jgi:ABC-type polysaccharide/polyol phosphate transport system ATPase subunit
MSEIVIVVESLSKSYLIGHRLPRGARKYVALRDVIGQKFNHFICNVSDFVHGRPVVQGDQIEEFWALRDISFQVRQGEILGIIGRNGAGKSTLLKILSRITEPTEGRVVIRGRVASLLEVATGFHPELTGRENIFLNGAILGMTQREIGRKFDEIVAFAQVEQFLDTPVKRFSSGMYLRLAFAVAAHLDPEILIMDEVLAVGDTEFQKKCVGKMEQVSRREGRTVLFVSHNLPTIAALTQRALLLDSGRLVANGPTDEVISSYLTIGNRSSRYVRPPAEATDAPHIRQIDVLTSDPNSTHQFGKPLEIKLWIKHERPMVNACLAIQIVNQFQQSVVYAWAYYPDIRFGTQKGETLLKCRFPSLRLNVGKYFIRAFLNGPPHGEIYEWLDDICSFEVVRTDQAIPWGWNPQDCTHHEDWHWTISAADEPQKAP